MRLPQFGQQDFNRKFLQNSDLKNINETYKISFGKKALVSDAFESGKKIVSKSSGFFKKVLAKIQNVSNKEVDIQKIAKIVQKIEPNPKIRRVGLNAQDNLIEAFIAGWDDKRQLITAEGKQIATIFFKAKNDTVLENASKAYRNGEFLEISEIFSQSGELELGKYSNAKSELLKQATIESFRRGFGGRIVFDEKFLSEEEVFTFVKKFGFQKEKTSLFLPESKIASFLSR